MIRLRGINLSDDYADGSLADCKNMSSRRFPYIATRRGRSRLNPEVYENVTAMTSWNKLVAVKGTQLLYDGDVVGTVTEGEKQFAVINTKLVIMPDKKYFDMSTRQLKDMASTVNTVGTVTFVAPTDSSDQYIQLTNSFSGDLTQYFNVNDGVTVTGCTAQPKNNLTLTIKAVEPRKITFMKATSKFTDITSATETAVITIARNVPDFDYICESNNRIWGCVNETQTIFASALGDPTNFYDYSGEDTDSYAVAVGSEGNFTGCHKLGSSVLFYKNDVLHKVLGDYPSNYSLYSYSIEGVLEGCHKSMQIINETLIYMSAHGIFTYSGGTTNFISSQLGDYGYHDGVAGTDGEKYFISCVDENDVRHVFTFDIKNNIWMREDDLDIIDFARQGNTLYFLTSDGEIYNTDDGEEDDSIEWSFSFNPFKEMYSSNNEVLEKKNTSKVIAKVEMSENAWCTISTRCDGGRWEVKKTIIGKTDGSCPLVIALNRCDTFELKMEGRGTFALKNLAREFYIGSDR